LLPCLKELPADLVHHLVKALGALDGGEQVRGEHAEHRFHQFPTPSNVEKATLPTYQFARCLAKDRLQVVELQAAKGDRQAKVF
jgi:hypothetical protein